MPTSTSFWKSPIFFSVILIAAIILIIALRITFIVQIFSFNTSSNDPTIPAGRIVITSDLKKPRRFNFIVFRNTTQPDSSIWMFRICGVPGDVVEMRNGDLFINNITADSLLTLSHSFAVLSRDTTGMHLDTSTVVRIDSENVLISYPDQLMRKRGIPYRRFIVPQEEVDTYLQKVFHQPWNIDHFGPLTVPPGSYFVLGDNRSNAMDSRYIGYISEKDFKGTVLNY